MRIGPKKTPNNQKERGPTFLLNINVFLCMSFPCLYASLYLNNLLIISI